MSLKSNLPGIKLSVKIFLALGVSIFFFFSCATTQFNNANFRYKKTSEFPPELLGNDTVLTLNLSRNQIQNLAGIETLTNLQEFRCSSCDLKEFPVELCLLPKLRYLELSKNEITNLPDCICEMGNLESLILWETEIYKLPKCLNKHPSLKVIDLKNIMMNFEEYDALLDANTDLNIIVSDPCNCHFNDPPLNND